MLQNIPKVYETQETTMQPAASGLHITGGILHLGVDVVVGDTSSNWACGRQPMHLPKFD